MSTLLSTHAASERTGLARQTLAKLRSIGGGPPFLKLGAKVFYPLAELEAWIGQHPLQTSTANIRARRAARGK
jgi:hypothetical protein